MRSIEVQTDGDTFEVRVYDVDRLVARHILRVTGPSGALVLCSGGPAAEPDVPTASPEGSDDAPSWY